MQQGQPIAFFSKAFSQRNMGLSTYENELLAVVMAVNKWRGYLLGRPFTIKTDQEAIKHKRGKDNVVADPLSRLHEHNPSPPCSLTAISVVVPKWKIDLKDSWKNDPAFRDIVAQITIDPMSHPGYSIQEGDLRYQGKWS